MERLLKDAVNPRPQRPMFFMVRAHSAYRAAAAQVMSGQVFEMNAALRLALEAMAYGVLIGDDQDKFEAWAKRSDSPKARAQVREDFQQFKLRAALRSLAPRIANDYQVLYERMIDWGAHPNEQGMFASTATERSDDAYLVRQIYLHASGLPHNAAMLTLYRVGMWIVALARLLWSARCELLGISHEYEALRLDPPRRHRDFVGDVSHNE
jgi:hypothetical protein